MPLKSIYLLPHGGVIIPGMEPGRNEDPERKKAADNLHKYMEEMAEDMRKDEIEFIFLTSPHGYIHPTDVLVVFNSVLEGWQYYHEAGEVQQQIFPANSQLAQIFHHLLEDADVPTSPVILADSNFPIKIGWGEGIPLHFIVKDPSSGPQTVLFSLPTNTGDGNDNSFMEQVAEVFLSLTNSPMMEEHNVSLVVSGDLSHRHDPDHEYGFDPSAKVFDEKTVEWCKFPIEDKYLELLELHEDAASCGIFGMGLIQACLDELGWENKFVEYELPTYFGMAVSSWKE